MYLQDTGHPDGRGRKDGGIRYKKINKYPESNFIGFEIEFTVVVFKLFKMIFGIKLTGLFSYFPEKFLYLF